MFIKTVTGTSTDSCLAQLRQTVQEADAVLIGAGAGLSTAAGFSYSGERFDRHFSDFRDKYGFTDMYTGGFYPYDTLEEYWAYWSRYIYINRYEDAPKPVYDQLYEWVRNKDYFVLTTNVDHCFQKAGFDKRRLFYTQGDYGLWQCSHPCCQETWDNEARVREMVERQRDRQIPAELVPRCPRCGRPLTMNLRVDDTFVQDEGWYRAAARYQDFVRRHADGSVLYWELGVGENTPGIIKYNFWQQAARNRRARYICINRKAAVLPRELEGRGQCLQADIAAVLGG